MSSGPKRLWVAVFLCQLLFISSAWGLTKGFEAMSFRPAVSGPYLSIWDSKNLDRWQWSIGTYATYGYRPFQLTHAGNRVQGILDHTLVQHFYGSVGLIDRWLQVGVEVPVGWWLRFTDPNATVATAERKFAVGDIQLHFKTELLDPDDYWVGLALVPFISIPTGYGRYYFGNGNIAGGGKLVAEVKPVERWQFAFNAGVYARERFDFQDIEKGHKLLYGFGTVVKVTDHLSAVAEISGETRLSGPFKERAETPVEVLGGIRWAFGGPGVTVTGGGGAGAVWGAVVPEYRGLLGIAYQSPIPPPPPPPRPSLDLIAKAVIYYPTDGFAITEETGVLLGRIADLLRDVPSVKIQILGYTDSMGGRNLNRIVSDKRAQRVKWYLGFHAVDADRMEALALGEADPRGSNKTREGRALNRRVEFSVVE